MVGTICLDGYDSVNSKVNNMLEILMKLYFIVPLILLTVTIGLVVSRTNKMKRFNECVGVITGFYENTLETRVGSYETKAISPVVSYSVNGEKHEFIGNYYSTNMKVGNRVNVLYDKNDCSKATIKNGLHLAPIITGGLTVLFIFPIIIYCVLKSKGIINF